MSTPLQLAFAVDCGADHAFTVWTTQIATWWPPDHTMSGNPDAIVLEPRVGGRIYERTRDGAEHDWGAVTAWDPPRSLSFTWHLGRSASDSTEVVVRFVARDAERTSVEIEHRGWERLAAADDVRERTRENWGHVVGHFIEHISTPGGR